MFLDVALRTFIIGKPIQQIVQRFIRIAINVWSFPALTKRHCFYRSLLNHLLSKFQILCRTTFDVAFSPRPIDCLTSQPFTQRRLKGESPKLFVKRVFFAFANRNFQANFIGQIAVLPKV